jgi:sirohydrochlorin cobaltochelatase
MTTLTEHLQQWLDAGGTYIGQIVIVSDEAGYRLGHRDDEAALRAGGAGLATEKNPAAAWEIAKATAEGSYRPVKGAPTMKSGWMLELKTLPEVREALDFIYPAALGNWVRFSAGEVMAVPLRQTLNRQTGMYRITQLLTDEDGDSLICENCGLDKCSRRIMWPMDTDRPLRGLAPEKVTLPAEARELPLLCLEACNFVVAKGRPFVKAKQAREKEAAEAKA